MSLIDDTYIYPDRDDCDHDNTDVRLDSSGNVVGFYCHSCKQTFET